MEAEKSAPRSRHPLSDCTNIGFLTPAPSLSSSPATATPSPNGSRNFGTSDRYVSQPISVVYSRRYTSEKRKNKENAIAIPFSSISMAKIFNAGEESNDDEVADLPEGSSIPSRKKQRAVSSEDVSNHALLEDFINKQKAYFDEIDEYKLPVEEIDTVEELE